MTYCDTNILTAFVNKNNLGESFGHKGIKRHQNIKGMRDKRAEEFLRTLKKCKISKKALMKDIGIHQSSMGAVLTSMNLRNIKLVDVDGLDTGKTNANKICKKNDKSTRGFNKNFCKDGKLRDNLTKNQIEDIRHFGSAIELNEKRILTGDRDLNSLNKFLEDRKVFK